ncbi:hypothetical protein AB0O67_23900 [Streptomyces sp. NPDC086077]
MRRHSGVPWRSAPRLPWRLPTEWIEGKRMEYAELIVAGTRIEPVKTCRL